MEHRLPVHLAELKAEVSTFLKSTTCPLHNSRSCCKTYGPVWSGLHRIESGVRVVEERVNRKIETADSCDEMLDLLLKKFEFIEGRMLKRIVEKYGGEPHLDIKVHLPKGGTNTHERIKHMYSYLAYLHGKAWGMDEMDEYLPMLSEVKKDVRDLEGKFINFNLLETIWAYYFETVFDMKKVDNEYRSLQLKRRDPADKSLISSSSNSSSVQETIDEGASVALQKSD